MAGFTFLKDKVPSTVNYIINELLKPENKNALFDDYLGITEVSILMYDGRTAIYPFFEKGRPEPIGIVFFTGITHYRSAVLYACMFDKKHRNQGIIKQWADKIKFDFIKRFAIHSVISYVIDKNPVSEHLLEKMGFKKIGVRKEAIMVKGKYRDLTEYYMIIKEG